MKYPILGEWIFLRWVVEYNEENLKYLCKEKRLSFEYEHVIDMGYKALEMAEWMDDFIVVAEYGDRKYLSTIEWITEIPHAPVFKIGNIVSVKKDEEGMINEIFWHLDQQSYYYMIKVGNKIKSKRYFEEELISKSKED